jgi:hypothetical protein
VAQSGSAPGWGPGGRRFKSCLPDRFIFREQPGTHGNIRENTGARRSAVLACSRLFPALGTAKGPQERRCGPSCGPRRPADVQCRRGLCQQHTVTTDLRRTCRFVPRIQLALRFWRPPCYRYTSSPRAVVLGAQSSAAAACLSRGPLEGPKLSTSSRRTPVRIPRRRCAAGRKPLGASKAAEGLEWCLPATLSNAIVSLPCERRTSLKDQQI